MTSIYIHAAPSGREHKAAAEAEAAGARASIPLDRTGQRPRRTIPGYVGVDRPVHLPFAQHIRAAIGTAPLGEWMRLFLFPVERRAEEQCPYRVGDVVLLGLVPAKVVEVRGRMCRVAFHLAGKTHTQSIAYNKLRPG